MIAQLSDSADSVFQTRRDNRITANAGGNVLDGGAGHDLLTGGADTYRFATRFHLGLDDGHDRVLLADGQDWIEWGPGISAAGVAPIMELRLDGELLGSTTVSSAGYADYAFTGAFTPSQVARLDVVFRNDAVIGGEDRNLYVDSVRFGDRLFRPAFRANCVPLISRDTTQMRNELNARLGGPSPAVTTPKGPAANESRFHRVA